MCLAWEWGGIREGFLGKWPLCQYIKQVLDRWRWWIERRVTDSISSLPRAFLGLALKHSVSQDNSISSRETGWLNIKFPRKAMFGGLRWLSEKLKEQTKPVEGNSTEHRVWKIRCLIMHVLVGFLLSILLKGFKVEDWSYKVYIFWSGSLCCKEQTGRAWVDLGTVNNGLVIGCTDLVLKHR